MYRTLCEYRDYGLIYLREYVPEKRTISYLGHNFHVQLPYMVFCKSGSMLHVCSSTSPVTSFKSKVFFSPLGNSRRDYSICQPFSCEIDPITIYWNSEFTNDAIGTVGEVFIPKVIRKIFPIKIVNSHAFKRWKKLSKSNKALEEFKKVETKPFKDFLYKLPTKIQNWAWKNLSWD
jgi:hypothetical protein